MTCLAVDKDGTECIWSYRPLRNKHRGRWEAPYSDEDSYQRIDLPKGSIKKLIEREMSWADEPFEMEG